MDIEMQEASILEDLLYVFMGFEGQYIRFRDDYNPANENDRLLGPQYKISPGLDPSLWDLTTTMLKIATYYGAVEAFVEVQSREEFGVVNHALSAAVRKLLRDYLVLIGQFEHQFLTSPSFTLHLLHLHTMPTSNMLSQLYSLAKEILKKNSMLEEDDEDDSMDDFDDVDNIIEALREGNDGGARLPGSKICRGGSVLALLTQRLSSMAGDPAARSLLSLLLREASRPYMNMLNEWLHRGVIRDPHSEFLIKEAKSIRRERLEEDYTDEYWEKRYTVRLDDVPPQLEAVKDKVLLAGKYLNVVRECGGVDVSKEMVDIPRTFEDIKFLDNVNSAYAHANTSLLELLLTTHALPARLKSLKHYFFLDRADFFQYFLDISNAELSKPAKKINIGKLQSLFDLALRQPGSIAASDPFKEDVKVRMNEVDLTKWLMRVVSVSGMDENAMSLDATTHQASVPNQDEKPITGHYALELDYKVPFPLSLVISRKTVLRYQLLFRHLLTLRHLEGLLSTSWKEHTTVYTWKHRSKYPQVEQWKRRAWNLRSRMLVFVQQLLYFCTMEVVEPNWSKLMKRLDEVKTVDQLMQHHVDFLDTCLKECMLTNSKLLKIHAKLLTTCAMFSSYTTHLSRSLIAADPELASPSARFEEGAESVPFDPENMVKLNENLGKYEHNFGRHLKILLDALNYFAATETVVLLSLCARLQMAQSRNESESTELVVAG
ncbi:gamma-tubulin complex component protein [Trichophaea hybrida]|nr:gamma-tubulin complex component protein [Trichophaea hybrida]